MMQPCLYRGTVTHRRLRPVPHALSYRVAAIFVNVDELDKATKSVHGLSYNRFNLFGIYDRDHGGGKTTIAEYAWKLVRQKPGTEVITQIFMLCYPRLLGFVFNPLSTYFCVDAAGQVRLMIYEVHNTFGGRHAYVTEVIEPGAPNFFQTAKTFAVSPFNKIEGHYSLKASAPAEKVSVGVALTTPEGPTLNAYFSAARQALTTGNLLRVFFGYPLMTLKVVAAIHYEALKLWLKGLKVQL